MAGQESQLWKDFKRCNNGTFSKLVRVEDRGEVTIPDVMALLRLDGPTADPQRTMTVLIELKVAKVRADGSTFTIPWRPGQPAWLSDWTCCGGACCALVQVPAQGYALLWPGLTAAWVQAVARPLTAQQVVAPPLNGTWISRGWLSVTDTMHAVHEAIHHRFQS